MQGGEVGRRGWAESFVAVRCEVVFGGKRKQGDRQTVAEEKRKKGRFWFRRGCGCGPALPRGDLPLCGRASCASCAPSCPCGGGAGSGGLVGLVEQKQSRNRER